MEKFDIEAYLDGELSSNEQAAFEAEMSRNSDFAREVQLMRQLTGDVQTQLLRDHITKVIAEDNPPDGSDNNSSKFWWGGLTGLILLCIAGYFIFIHENPTGDAAQTLPPNNELPQNDAPTNNTPSQPQETNKPSEPSQTAPAKKKPKPSQPIASATPLPDPFYPAPNIRGGGQDSARKALLDQIWYTDFPPAQTNFVAPFDESAQLLKDRKFPMAYVRLQILERDMPENDTLRFLKAYCLIEMGEGKEARLTFDALQSAPATWADYIQWYKGLAYFLEGNKDQTLQTFRAIKANPKHHFQKAGKKALDLLE